MTTESWRWLELAVAGTGPHQVLLTELAEVYPPGPVPAGVEPAAFHLALRRRVATRLGSLLEPAPAAPGTVPEDLVALAFAGGVDVDLRDAAHVGHGWLLRNTPDYQAVRDGALCCLAMTEPGRGSTLHPQLQLRQGRAGQWQVTGTKTAVSRYLEADLLLLWGSEQGSPVLLSCPLEPVRAGVHSLVVRPLHPSGLAGWSWSELTFTQTPLPAVTVVATGEVALKLLRAHLAEYRVRVAALVAGAAWRSLQQTAAHIGERTRTGQWPAGAHAHAAQLGGHHAALLAAAAFIAMDPGPDPVTSSAVKAFTVEVAGEALRWCTGVLGSSSVELTHSVGKAARDVDAYRFADGAQGALHAFVGAQLLRGHL